MREAVEAIVVAGGIQANIASFRRHLRAENLSPKTIEPYTECETILIMVRCLGWMAG